MSEFELVTIWDEMADSVVTVLFGYFSITSAFLAAGYLVGPSLPKVLRRTIVGLYSFMALTLIAWCERYVQSLIILRDLMREGASWHVVVNEPAFILYAIMYAVLSAMLAVFVSSVWYFTFTQQPTNVS